MHAIRLVILLFLMMAGLNQAQAGPVIIDGTDANEHGSDDGGQNQHGWLYMQKVLEALAKQVPSGAPHVIVVLGTVPDSQARKAIDSAFYKSSLGPKDSGWRIEYKVDAGVNNWLEVLSISNTGILYIPTYNETEGDLKPDEMAMINKHGTEIARYVKQAGVRDQGGALFAMAESKVNDNDHEPFEWLHPLLPGVRVIDRGLGGIETSINLTESGIAGLPGLPPEELKDTVPWHNYFEENLGALTVYATARDESGLVRNIILGGAVADLLISVSVMPDPVSLDATITYNIQIINNGPDAASLVTVTNDLPVSTTPLSCSTSEGGECNAIGNRFKITFQSLPADTHMAATVTIMATVGCPPDGSTTIIDTARVESVTFDPDLQKNVTMVATTVNRDSQAQITPLGLELGPFDAQRKFKKIPKKDPKEDPPSFKSFTIRNTSGCFSLTAKFLSVIRTTEEVNKGKLDDSDDRALFPVSVMNADGSETPLLVGDQSAQSMIAPKQSRIFQVRFHPKIPAFKNQPGGLLSTLVLPCEVKTLLTISDDHDVKQTLPLTGKINRNVILINPDAPARAPVVTLAQSGDELTVEFTVYVCDPLDLQSVTYEFLDSGNRIPPLILTDELRNTIQKEIDAEKLHAGQSFKARKTHIIAEKVSKMTRVRVTVKGQSSTDTATSGVVESSASITGNSSMGAENYTVLLPTVNLPPSAAKGVTRNGSKRIRPGRSERKQGMTRKKHD